MELTTRITATSVTAAEIAKSLHGRKLTSGYLARPARNPLHVEFTRLNSPEERA
jgi:hypothetical protein